MKSFFGNFRGIYVDLLKGLSSFAFLINPSVDHLAEDHTKLIDVEYLEQPFKKEKAYFKTPDEVDEYFLSRIGSQKDNFKEYKENYKPLILSVSRIFETPFSFQSCLIFKESRFNKKARSHVGAMGVAQFTKDTYNFLSRALRLGENSINSIYKEQSYWENLNFIEKPKEKKLNYASYNTKVFGQMYLMWSEYLKENGLKSIKLNKKSYKDVLYDPHYSIGLSAMYLYYLKHRVKYDVKKYVAEISSDHPDFILSLAGAYNQGARRVLKAVNKSKERPDFSKWILYQSKIKETRGYIKSIRTCMLSETKGRRKKVLTAFRPYISLKSAK